MGVASGPGNFLGKLATMLFVSCSGKSSANVAVELDSIFASGKHPESGFNRAWQDKFPFYHRVCGEN